MKFLCTKVKSSWLSSQQNKSIVEQKGLKIFDSFIGIELKDQVPNEKEFKIVNDVVDSLFGNHRVAFPVKVIEL